MSKVVFFAPGLGPPFNEAWKNDIKFLADEFNAKVLASDKGIPKHDVPSNYDIVVHKNKFIRYLIFGLFAPNKLMNSKIIFFELLPFQVQFHFLIKFVNIRKCVCRISTDSVFEIKNRYNNYFFRKLCHKFKFIIVSDERAREKFIERSGRTGNILILRPGISLDRFKPATLPESQAFTILMASSPLEESGLEWRDAFHNKGIFILLKAVDGLLQKYRIRLVLIWRGGFVDEIKNLIKEMGIKGAEVINGIVDMYGYYASTNITLLPACSPVSTPNYPNSIMESIAVGRPVIVSRILGISEIIVREGCGIAISPDVSQLSSAIEKMIVDYEGFRCNCQKTAEKYFDFRENASELRKTLLQ